MRRQRGFTYLGVLVAVAVLGIGLTAASEVWVTLARRERMAQLQWIGEQYVQAIGSYYNASPGSVKAYPKTLQDLLEDKRYVTMRRHLRQPYANPVTGKDDWELLMTPEGGIRGVRATLPAQIDPDGLMTREFSFAPNLR